MVTALPYDPRNVRGLCATCPGVPNRRASARDALGTPRTIASKRSRGVCPDRTCRAPEYFFARTPGTPNPNALVQNQYGTTQRRLKRATGGHGRARRRSSCGSACGSPKNEVAGNEVWHCNEGANRELSPRAVDRLLKLFPRTNWARVLTSDGAVFRSRVRAPCPQNRGHFRQILKIGSYAM